LASTKEISRFIRWTNENVPYRGLICHFYILGKEKQFYTKADYAHFNLLLDSQEWLIKGTPEHGISSLRGKRSQMPCLNSFEINAAFCEALKKMAEQGNTRFNLGIIFNKRRLENLGYKVVSVVAIKRPPSPYPPPNHCHYYDWAYKRHSLWPFNKCSVTRVEIPMSGFIGSSIARIPRHVVMALLVRKDQEEDIRELLVSKKFKETEIFSVL
jgi:hypothetical protein